MYLCRQGAEEWIVIIILYIFLFLQVKGFDGDEGENAVIRYELVRSPHGGDIYELDRHSGMIRLRRKPDLVGQHELIVKAYDGGK